MTSKFQVGDKVRVINPTSPFLSWQGYIKGVHVEGFTHGYTHYGVNFQLATTGDAVCIEGTFLFIEQHLRLVEPADPQPLEDAEIAPE